MRWGRVEATAGFFLLIAWVNYWDSQLLVPQALLACVLHELGHYVAITWLGGGVKLIRLTAVGAEMVLDRPLGYWQEGVAALENPGKEELMALTNPGCMVQHCLPAHRGEEITADVFEEHAEEIFDEAENRLHAQKAVMYLLMGGED